jgi:hypothetical protein
MGQESLIRRVESSDEWQPYLSALGMTGQYEVKARFHIAGE